MTNGITKKERLDFAGILERERNIFIGRTLIPVAGFFVFTFYYWFGRYFSLKWWTAATAKSSTGELLVYVWWATCLLVMVHDSWATYRIGEEAMHESGGLAVVCLMFFGPLQLLWFAIILFLIWRTRIEYGITPHYVLMDDYEWDRRRKGPRPPGVEVKDA
ncbi:MAG: hypothetical protein KKB90_08905 [Actinobacteria bacterium]|nr:hypothetical protein [Actinomycetota bacterium]MBU4219060.1 hypothetical protein [Actinomycetota bacterium]MBU4359248.1 hypothetical protein [Actinomycetota bacterium]MCG2819190.1 hypothetical protein [Actinomycetes bacterium]